MTWFVKILSPLILLGKVKFWPWVLIPMFPLGSRAHWHKGCPLWIFGAGGKGLRGGDRKGSHSHSGTQLHRISSWGAELRSRFTSGGGDMDIWKVCSSYSCAPWVMSFLPKASQQVLTQQMLSWDVTMEVVRSPRVVSGKLEIDILLVWKGTHMFISKAVVL